MSRIIKDVYDPTVCDELPAMFADGSSIVKVCARKLGIARSTYYEWKEKYPEFKKAAEKGEQLAQCAQEDVLEEGARGKIENYNATSQIFLMKCRYRKDYGEEKQTDDVAKTLLEKLLSGQATLTTNDDK